MADEDPAVARATALVALGLRPGADPSDVDTAALAARRDPDARVRAAALGALVRAGSPVVASDAWTEALTDAAPAVRRRAAELTPALADRGGRGDTNEASNLVAGLITTLSDEDATVIESAAWALGELAEPAARAGATRALATTATTHDDPLAREAAVAALGSLGDEAGLEAILQACTDKPAIRRRAVLALAPFEGVAVEAALSAALKDRDWQVRQAAEDLHAAADETNEDDNEDTDQT